MEKKFLIVRLQEPTLNLDTKKAQFVVGQTVKVELTEDAAVSEINEILNGPNSSDLELVMPADFGYAIIPFYTNK